MPDETPVAARPDALAACRELVEAMDAGAPVSDALAKIREVLAAAPTPAETHPDTSPPTCGHQPPPPADHSTPPRMFWSPSKRTFYGILERDEWAVKSACEPGHEVWTGLKTPPGDAVELRPVDGRSVLGEPSAEAIERASEAAHNAYYTAVWDNATQDEREGWRDVVRAVAAALGATSPTGDRS